MEKITTISLDLVKNVFQVHGVDTTGEVVVRRQLRRGEVLRFFDELSPCLIGIEACGTAHYWGRERSKLGHDVKLMPPPYVKPYVKRGKTDAADAKAIAEAVMALLGHNNTCPPEGGIHPISSGRPPHHLCSPMIAHPSSFRSPRMSLISVKTRTDICVENVQHGEGSPHSRLDR